MYRKLEEISMLIICIGIIALFTSWVLRYVDALGRYGYELIMNFPLYLAFINLNTISAQHYG